MKYVLFSFILIASTAATAAIPYSESLRCEGKIHARPSGMHPDYAHIGMRLIAFQPSRRDGTKAASLGWNFCYGKSARTVATQLNDNACGDEVWYSGLLQYDATTKTLARQGLRLTPVGAGWVGTYGRSETVVGNYYYDVSCTVAP